MYLHTETLIQSTNTNSLIGVNANMNRHKHKGYCTRLCSVNVIRVIHSKTRYPPFQKKRLFTLDKESKTNCIKLVIKCPH